MRRRTLLAAMAVLIAATASAAERTWSPAAADPAAQAEPAWGGDVTASVFVGDPAPVFSYLGVDGAWHDSRALGAGRAVLLVFGAQDRELVALDHARPLLDQLGVRTVAVLDMRAGSAARFARRLRLSYSVVVDPQCAIGSLYGSLDFLTRHDAPSFFVLDEHGTIRGAGRGTLPSPQGLVAISARSLGRLLPDSWNASDSQPPPPQGHE